MVSKVIIDKQKALTIDSGLLKRYSMNLPNLKNYRGQICPYSIEPGILWTEPRHIPQGNPINQF